MGKQGILNDMKTAKIRNALRRRVTMLNMTDVSDTPTRSVKPDDGGGWRMADGGWRMADGGQHDDDAGEDNDNDDNNDDVHE